MGTVPQPPFCLEMSTTELAVCAELYVWHCCGPTCMWMMHTGSTFPNMPLNSGLDEGNTVPHLLQVERKSVWSLHLCMYVCMCVRMHVCMHVCMHVSIYLSFHPSIHISIHICLDIYLNTSIAMYLYLSLSILVYPSKQG